jgi:hypothetical protein
VDSTLPTALCRATKRGVCVHGFGDGQNIENASDWKESYSRSTVINEIDQHECSLVLTANCTSGSFAWEDHCMIIYILQLEDDEVSEEFQ